MSGFLLTSSNCLMFNSLGFLQTLLYILTPPLPLQNSPSKLSERLYPGLQCLVIPQIKYNSQLLGCAFFFFPSVNTLGDHKGTQTSLLCLNFVRNQSLGTNRGLLGPFTSLEGPYEFGRVSFWFLDLLIVGWYSWALIGSVQQVQPSYPFEKIQGEPCWKILGVA